MPVVLTDFENGYAKTMQKVTVTAQEQLMVQEQELFKLSKTMCKLTTKVAAYDGKSLWVTGKNWPQIYKIKL